MTRIPCLFPSTWPEKPHDKVEESLQHIEVDVRRAIYIMLALRFDVPRALSGDNRLMVAIAVIMVNKLLDGGKLCHPQKSTETYATRNVLRLERTGIFDI